MSAKTAAMMAISRNCFNAGGQPGVELPLRFDNAEFGVYCENRIVILRERIASLRMPPPYFPAAFEPRVLR